MAYRQRPLRRQSFSKIMIAGTLGVTLYVAFWQPLLFLLLAGTLCVIAYWLHHKQSPAEQPDESWPNLPPSLQDTQPFAMAAPIPETHLTLENLLRMEWLSFEYFCKLYFELIGAEVVKTSAGADGGVDLELFKHGEEQPFALVQCKTRTQQYIGVEKVRALYGVMFKRKIGRGMLICNKQFSNTAIQEAQECKGLRLMDAYQLWEKIEELTTVQRDQLEAFLRGIDYLTPTCPNCEIKLVQRTSARGSRFWGCPNYSRRYRSCCYTLSMAKNSESETSAQYQTR